MDPGNTFPEVPEGCVGTIWGWVAVVGVVDWNGVLIIIGDVWDWSEADTSGVVGLIVTPLVGSASCSESICFLRFTTHNIIIKTIIIIIRPYNNKFCMHIIPRYPN